MNIEIKITADEKALEFSRNIGGISEYFKEALMTNAMEEPVQTIEPDPVKYDGSTVSAEELRAKSIAFSKVKGKDAMRLILDKLKVQKLSDLDADGRILAAQMIEEATNA